MTVIAILLLVGYNNFGSEVRIINDYYDRSDYADRGVWILTGQIPYVDIATEYPQVPVYPVWMVTWLAKTILPSSWPVSGGILPFYGRIHDGRDSLLATWQM